MLMKILEVLFDDTILLSKRNFPLWDFYCQLFVESNFNVDKNAYAFFCFHECDKKHLSKLN